MDAQEFVNELKTQATFITIEHFDQDGNCDGSGPAIILDGINEIAVVVGQGIGFPSLGIGPGAIVSFRRHPEARHPRMVGTAAYLVPTMVDGVKYGKDFRR